MGVARSVVFAAQVRLMACGVFVLSPSNRRLEESSNGACVMCEDYMMGIVRCYGRARVAEHREYREHAAAVAVRINGGDRDRGSSTTKMTAMTTDLHVVGSR
jgi:hypothetical protein